MTKHPIFETKRLLLRPFELSDARKWDKFEDQELYGILKTEWEKQRINRST